MKKKKNRNQRENQLLPICCAVWSKRKRKRHPKSFQKPFLHSFCLLQSSVYGWASGVCVCVWVLLLLFFLHSYIFFIHIFHSAFGFYSFSLRHVFFSFWFLCVCLNPRHWNVCCGFFFLRNLPTSHYTEHYVHMIGAFCMYMLKCT